jgi:hypothetical protein
MRERHNLLLTELKSSKKASETLASELVDLLSEERARVAAIDKEKRLTNQGVN